MRIAYFDCFCGISGDMILGALLDLGFKLEDLRSILGQLNISGFDLQERSVKRGGITGRKIDINISQKSQPLRNLTHIRQIIEQSSLSNTIKNTSCHIFNRLAKAEARIHGLTIEKVHFHEIGALDTIIDVVGAVAGLNLLKIDKVSVSAINVGSGTVNTQHGMLPVPAPAALELLKGLNIYSDGTDCELATPTGAAIISSLAENYSSYPKMRVNAIGYGAGNRQIKNIPNLLRITIGDTHCNYPSEQISILEADIDDMNPEYYGWIMKKAFEAGAVDVCMIPIYIKNNRPATRINILSLPEDAQNLAGLLLSETTSLGVRIFTTERIKLERKIRPVQTLFGQVNVKIALLDGKIKNIAPEYRDCIRLADTTKRPLKEIYQAALTAADALINE